MALLLVATVADKTFRCMLVGFVVLCVCVLWGRRGPATAFAVLVVVSVLVKALVGKGGEVVHWHTCTHSFFYRNLTVSGKLSNTNS